LKRTLWAGDSGGKLVLTEVLRKGNRKKSERKKVKKEGPCVR